MKIVFTTSYVFGVQNVVATAETVTEETKAQVGFVFIYYNFVPGISKGSPFYDWFLLRSTYLSLYVIHILLNRYMCRYKYVHILKIH